jgi:hypothetical protein
VLASPPVLSEDFRPLKSQPNQAGLDISSSQLYNGEVIPDFDTNGNLPPGVHKASLAEVEHRFAHNATRKALFVGLARVVAILSEAKCPEVHLDGSYITTKEEPDDYDLCFEPTGLKATEELRKFLSNKEGRKTEYLGDIFVRMPEPPYYVDHVTHWQKDGRNDDIIKGILKIELRTESHA